jgi:hypothetical protein
VALDWTAAERDRRAIALPSLAQPIGLVDFDTLEGRLDTGKVEALAIPRAQ